MNLNKKIILGIVSLSCLGVGNASANVMQIHFNEDRPMIETVNILETWPEATEEDLKNQIIYTIGTDEIDYKEIYESRPKIGSIAYSVVLVRMEEGADVEAAKEKILETVNPRKWYCVGIEKEEVIVKNKGDLIILIMVENETLREKIEEGFDNL